MTAWTFVLTSVAPALLPPANDKDSFYQALGLTRRSSPEDIRKAYRKLSLQYHPDKVAQKQTMTPDEAAARYEFIQEAYNCLKDPDERKLYHELDCSTARYRFLKSGGMTNPMAVQQNLSRASRTDQSRLLLVAVLVAGLVLLQPILICVAVNQATDEEGSNVTWTLVFLPTWIYLFGSLLLQGFLVFKLSADSRSGAREGLVVSMLETSCWLIGGFLMVLAWDGHMPNRDWRRLSIPFFMALFIRVYSKSRRKDYYRGVIAKMISPDQLESTVLEKPLEDMSPKELEELSEKHVVISVNPELVATALTVLREEEANGGVAVTADDLEAIRVQSSPEYQSAQEMIGQETNAITKLVFVGIPLIALIASKCQGSITASWWIIFLPIWIVMAIQILGSLATCFLVTGELEIEVEEVEEQEENTNNDDGNDDPVKQDPEADPTEPLPASPAQTNGSLKIDVPPVERPAESGTTSFSPTEGPMEDMPRSTFATGDNIDKDDDEEDGGGDDDEEEPALDEDAFRAWQAAQKYANESANEATAKAQSTCMATCFQLLFVLLIVAKLQKDYEMKDSFNAFWILFPVFVITGMVLCCCCCLIYGSSALADEDNAVVQGEAEDDQEGDPSTPADNTTPAETTPDNRDVETGEAQEEAPADEMDELD